MSVRVRLRDVCLVPVGVACLLLKRWFGGFLGDLALNYLGNVSASFAAYFVVSTGAGRGLNRALIAGIALLAVELFVLTDGFGIMSNVCDPYDHIANALGVGLAYAVDAAFDQLLRGKAGGPA